MECEECGTSFEGAFCPSCGAPAPGAGPPTRKCERCGTAFVGNFCPQCGWPSDAARVEEDGLGRALLGVGWSVAVVVFLVYVGSVAASLLLVTPDIVDGIRGDACADCFAIFFWFDPTSPFLISGVALRGSGFLAWFFALLAIVLGILLYLAIRHGPATLRAFRLPLARVEAKARSNSTLVSVGQIFMALLFFDILYLAVILPAIGITPEAPPGFAEFPTWYLLYSLVNAAVWEEAATRLLLIGLPLALGSLAVRSVQSLQGTVRGGAAYVLGGLKHLFGGQVDPNSSTETKIAGGFLVVMAAAIFAALHPLTGWGLWKLVDTFVAGVALGYLFLRRGLVAAILLHLSVNALNLLVQATGAETQLVADVLVGLLTLALVVLGTGFFIYYGREVGRLLLRPFRRAPPTGGPRGSPSGPPPAPTDPAFAVTCPQCGGHEARYVEGALRCAACGTPL